MKNKVLGIVAFTLVLLASNSIAAPKCDIKKAKKMSKDQIEVCAKTAPKNERSEWIELENMTGGIKKGAAKGWNLEKNQSE